MYVNIFSLPSPACVVNGFGGETFHGEIVP